MSSQLSGISYPSNKPVLIVGSTVFTSFTDLIMLVGNYSTSFISGTFRKAFQTSGYQVPVGKTFQCRAYRVVNGAGTFTASGFQLFSSDTDQGFQTNALSGTQTYAYGAASPSSREIHPTGTAGAVTEGSIYLPFPSSLYPSWTANTAATAAIAIYLYGYEVNN